MSVNACRFTTAAVITAILLLTDLQSPSVAEPPRIPVLVPITGFLSLEGTSQRNGAALALEGSGIALEVDDTATSPEVAINAFERTITSGRARDDIVAIVAPMLGTQMLALVPLADEFAVPMITISGTARITELGSPNVFRFFPGDAVVKAAHARYAVKELGVTRPAVLFQTTAYGQSGRTELDRNLTGLNAPPVLSEGLDVSVKDMLPILSKVRETRADALLLHLHAGPSALVIRQARAMGLDIPIVAGSAMHQPETAALLEPSELAGVCAESGASPISESDPAMRAFVEHYRDTFDREPDAFALAQYDGVKMLLAAIGSGAHDAAAIRDYLKTNSYNGLAMRYESDGKGNMAHSAVILCYDGNGRVPAIVKRYNNITGAL
ncbi:MAG: ABC transporter substrate-binding protein [Alphaproteobacteria bacterium]|nr:ABC transporter substrate-binding protein [Alphaproteobacteria bacterium]